MAVELTSVQQADGSGEINGINLDGLISDETDPGGCFRPDFVDPVDGEIGVDDQFSFAYYSSMGMLSPEERTDLPSQTIEVHLRDVDSLEDDGCVEVQIANLEPVHTRLERGRFRALSTGGAVEVALGSGPGHTLSLRRPAVEGTLTPDGALEDVTVAGHIAVDDVVTAFVEFDPMVDPELARATLAGIADVEPGSDGQCQSLSATFAGQALEL